MNINLFSMGMLVVFIAYHAWLAWQPIPLAPTSGLPAPMQVGKQRSFVNMTRDAGMFVELQRRQATRTANRFQKGFTNGVLESFITGICTNCPEGICPPEIYEVEDGGNAFTESCNVFDEAAGELIDLGDANTNLCPI